MGVLSAWNKSFNSDMVVFIPFNPGYNSWFYKLAERLKEVYQGYIDMKH